LHNQSLRPLGTLQEAGQVQLDHKALMATRCYWLLLAQLLLLKLEEMLKKWEKLG
jgi:hypothetical protein